MSYDKERILILIKTIKKMENKVKVWIARDKSGELWLYQSIPNRDVDEWFCKGSCCKMDSSNFPSVKWEDDEPTEAYITLAEPQEKSQPKIDWEQRRYEIAKEMLPVIYRQGVEALKYGQSVKWEDTVDGAVNFADMLIKKLKEQSE